MKSFTAVVYFSLYVCCTLKQLLGVGIVDEVLMTHSVFLGFVPVCSCAVSERELEVIYSVLFPKCLFGLFCFFTACSLWTWCLLQCSIRILKKQNYTCFPEAPFHNHIQPIIFLSISLLSTLMLLKFFSVFNVYHLQIFHQNNGFPFSIS